MSKFILKAETSHDNLEWGALAWLCNPPSTGSRNLNVADVKLEPGCGHDFHRHPRQEEVIFVISGKVEQWLEQKKQILEDGDAVFIDAGIVHASFNAGNSIAHLLVILGPCAGDIGYEIEDVAAESPWNKLRG